MSLTSLTSGLPLPHNGVVSEADASTDRTAARPKILVIDDTPANIRLMAAALEPIGFNVIGADSGEQGLELVRSEQPDLLLLDLMMPGMDGYEVCRLRADPATTSCRSS
jgi:CheY-like chemotaxis protein